MIERYVKLITIASLVLSLAVGFTIIDLGETGKNGIDVSDTGSAEQTISTGSMPADTMEDRAEMRKMTATSDYYHAD